MAAPAERRVYVEFVFDRAGDQLLAQAYRMLVPEHRARMRQRREGDEHLQTPPVDDKASGLQLVSPTGDEGDRSALGA